MPYVIYGTSKDIELNSLGHSGKLSMKDAETISKNWARGGFASIVEEINPKTHQGFDFIKSYWNKKYWEEFLKRREKYKEVVE